MVKTKRRRKKITTGKQKKHFASEMPLNLHGMRLHRGAISGLCTMMYELTNVGMGSCMKKILQRQHSGPCVNSTVILYY